MTADASLMDCRLADNERGFCEDCGVYFCHCAIAEVDGPEIPQFEGTRAAIESLTIIKTKGQE